MRSIIYLTTCLFLLQTAISTRDYSSDSLHGITFYQKPDLPQTPKGEYILHKEKINDEIQILKEKYPELNSEIISYKFLYAPKTGKKQFFESDGGLFDVLKRYSRSIKPGDIINITEVFYKISSDSASSWKKFSPKLHFIYE
jgi:hypothetical protein